MFLEKLNIGSKNNLYEIGIEQIIGSSKECSLVLNDELVSEKHLIIRKEGNSFFLIPISKENIFLNNRKVKEKVKLNDGDKLVVGSTIFYFRENISLDETMDILKLEKKTPVKKKKLFKIEKTPQNNLKSSSNIENLPIFEINVNGKRYKRPILKDEVVFGSSKKCDIYLEGENISPRHAKVFREKENFYIIDLESDIGTILNGKKIFREKLKSGDIIKIGDFNIIFFNPSEKKVEEKTTKKTKKKYSIKIHLKPVPVILILLFLFIFLSIFLLIYHKKEKCKNYKEVVKEINSLISQNNFEKANKRLGDISSCLPQKRYEKLKEKIRHKRKNLNVFINFKNALENDDLNLAYNILVYNLDDEKLKEEGKILLLEKYMEKARKNYKNKNLSKLIKNCEIILTIDKNNLFALKMLCVAKFFRKNYKSSLKLSQKILKEEGLDEPIFYISEVSKYFLKKYKEVINEIGEVENLLKNKKPFYLLKAKAYIMAGKLKGAKLTLEKLLTMENPPPIAGELYREITGTKRLKNYKEAEQINFKNSYDREFKPFKIKNRENKIEKLFLTGKLNEIKNRNLPKYEDFYEIVKYYQKGLTQYNKGNMYEAAKNWLVALNRERKLHLNQKSIYSLEIVKNISNFLIKRAEELMSSGSYGDAHYILENIVYFSPENNKAVILKEKIENFASRFYRAGFECFENNDLKCAKENFKKVLNYVSKDNIWYKKASKKLELIE